MGEFSLLFKNKEKKGGFKNNNFINDLRIDEIIMLPKNKSLYSSQINIFTFLTTEKEDILMRNILFDELLNNEKLYNAFIDLIPKIEIINELRVQKDIIQDIEDSLFTIKEIENYVEIIVDMNNFFKDYYPKSSCLIAFKNEVLAIFNDDNFINLKKNMKDLVYKISDIKSISLGMNLNAQFKPTDAGVLSINTEKIKYKTLFERLKHSINKNDDLSTVNMPITLNKDLTQNENSIVHMMFLKCLYKITASSILTWKPLIKRYLMLNTKVFTEVYDELIFIKASLDFIKKLNDNNFKTCYPSILNSGENEDVEGVYNVHLALRNDAISNNLTFDKEGRMYVLTGPNHGGKSIYTISIGILYTLLHLGLPLPAAKARVCLTDGIFTHFPQNDENTLGKGRFGMECKEISEVSKQLTKESLVLFDEVFSSTSSFEATSILIEILKAYGVAGLRLIFSTHLHELAMNKLKVNEYVGNISKLDTLTATISDGNVRNFKIVRTSPEGSSFASDVAKKYNLTTDELLSCFTTNN